MALCPTTSNEGRGVHMLCSRPSPDEKDPSSSFRTSRQQTHLQEKWFAKKCKARTKIRRDGSMSILVCVNITRLLGHGMNITSCSDARGTVSTRLLCSALLSRVKRNMVVCSIGEQPLIDSFPVSFTCLIIQHALTLCVHAPAARRHGSPKLAS